MLYKTQGIVLHSLPYKEVYTILHIYTKDFGRVSYMVARKRGKRSSVSQALFMPLSVLDLEVEHQNKRDIQRIKEEREATVEASQAKAQAERDAQAADEEAAAAALEKMFAEIK